MMTLSELEYNILLAKLFVKLGIDNSTRMRNALNDENIVEYSKNYKLIYSESKTNPNGGDTRRVGYNGKFRNIDIYYNDILVLSVEYYLNYDLNYCIQTKSYISNKVDELCTCKRHPIKTLINKKYVKKYLELLKKYIEKYIIVDLER